MTNNVTLFEIHSDDLFFVTTHFRNTAVAMCRECCISQAEFEYPFIGMTNFAWDCSCSEILLSSSSTVPLWKNEWYYTRYKYLNTFKDNRDNNRKRTSTRSLKRKLVNRKNTTRTWGNLKKDYSGLFDDSAMVLIRLRRVHKFKRRPAIQFRDIYHSPDRENTSNRTLLFDTWDDVWKHIIEHLENGDTVPDENIDLIEQQLSRSNNNK